MTPEQRAEHIVTELDCDSCQYSHEVWQATTVYIAEQIRVSEEAAYKRGQEDIRESCTVHQHNQYSEGYKRGVEEEREECAKIADEGTRQDSGQDIALRIRARTGEEKQ